MALVTKQNLSMLLTALLEETSECILFCMGCSQLEDLPQYSNLLWQNKLFIRRFCNVLKNAVDEIERYLTN